MKNKGFSLVELIIVIAIMAILAAAIAPALIRYIDKSRRADDVAAAETINTAISAALANEDAYSEVAGKMDGSVLASAAPGSNFTVTGATTFNDEVNSSIGGGAPKLKYTKTTDSVTPGQWAIGISTNGKPVVWIGSSTAPTKWEIQPEISASYK